MPRRNREDIRAFVQQHPADDRFGPGAPMCVLDLRAQSPLYYLGGVSCHPALGSMLVVRKFGQADGLGGSPLRNVTAVPLLVLGAGRDQSLRHVESRPELCSKGLVVAAPVAEHVERGAETESPPFVCDPKVATIFTAWKTLRPGAGPVHGESTGLSFEPGTPTPNQAVIHIPDHRRSSRWILEGAADGQPALPLESVTELPTPDELIDRWLGLGNSRTSRGAAEAVSRLVCGFALMALLVNPMGDLRVELNGRQVARTFVPDALREGLEVHLLSRLLGNAMRRVDADRKFSFEFAVLLGSPTVMVSKRESTEEPLIGRDLGDLLDESGLNRALAGPMFDVLRRLNFGFIHDQGEVDESDIEGRISE